MKSFTAILISLFTFSFGVRLPSYFKKCNFNDPQLQQCILKSALSVWPKLKYGDKNIHLHSFEPVNFSKMEVNTGNLNINLTDGQAHGLSHVEIEDFIFDFEKKHIHIKMYEEKVSTVGHYEINGRLLLLPIMGSGHANFTFVKGNYDYHSDFEIIEKAGKHYVHLLNNDMPYTIKKAYYLLENLFNGNKELGDNILKALNENWKDVDSSIGRQIGQALASVLGAQLQLMFFKVPLEEFFIDYK